MTMNGMCTAHCSRSDIYGGLRYCGIGKEYEDGDSADCTQCIPTFDKGGMLQQGELEPQDVSTHSTEAE